MPKRSSSSAVVKMFSSDSNVLRFAEMSATAPRIFGQARVLRGGDVGVRRPITVVTPMRPAQRSDVAEESSLPPPDPESIAEAARLQGYAVGLEEGRAAGMAAAEAAIGESVARLAALLGNVHENHQAFYRAAERQVVDLALQIAQKVVEREVENMPDLAVNIIRAALEEMDARTATRVRVNPYDEELLRRRWREVVPPGVPADRIELLADERVAPGGGVIESAHGQVDAQLETKLAQLGNALWTFVMDINNADADGESADA